MERKALFASPLYKVEMEDAEWRDALLDDIFKWQNEHPQTTVRSSFGDAWHSPTNGYQREAFRPLVDMLHKRMLEIAIEEGYIGGSNMRLLNLWANINGPNSWHVPHHHGDALWSCVYYLDVPSKASDIEFLDPRGAQIVHPVLHDTSIMRDRHVEPAEKGTALFFPGSLMHHVTPFPDEGTRLRQGRRITISANFAQIVRPTATPLSPPKDEDTPHYVKVKNVLTRAECLRLRKLVEEEGETFSEARVGEGRLDKETRDSRVRFLQIGHRDSMYYWLYQRVCEVAKQVNREHYQLDMSGMQPPQLTLYGEGQHYDVHTDRGGTAWRRSLSCSILLQNARKGGAMHFPDAGKGTVNANMGDALFFRADEPHSALPVIKGQRVTLIVWFEQQ